MSLPVPALEAYADHFDDVFRSLPQRRAFRTYLAGLLAARGRNKTLTALAGAEPVRQAQAASVQRLHHFLSDAKWDVDALTARRIELLGADPRTAPHAQGVLVLDDSGDRKWGTKTAHVGTQPLGAADRDRSGIVAVTCLWADSRAHAPLHVEPYTPAAPRLPGEPAASFCTKSQLAFALVMRALALGIPFRAVVADRAVDDGETLALVLSAAGIPHVIAHRGGGSGGRFSAGAPEHFVDGVAELRSRAWVKLPRDVRAGRPEPVWVAEVRAPGVRPSGRALVATTDRRALPPLSTWYLTTNLSRADAPFAEIVRLYGLCTGAREQFRREKRDLGWADFQVRRDQAIRRHWALVCCALGFSSWQRAVGAGASHLHDPEPMRAAGSD